jgi:putative iron-regulated protein
MTSLAIRLGLLATALLLLACEPETKPETTAQPATTEQTPNDAMAATTTHLWSLAAVNATQALDAAKTLEQAINDLVAEPQDTQLETARQQWHAAHDKLLALSAYFALGEVNPGLFRQLSDSHFLLDAHPIEPGYLDYFDVYQHSGIVNDIVLPLNADTIRRQHGMTSDTDVVLGLHAIAYLLWGENQQRPVSDFQPGALTEAQRRDGLKIIDLPQQRRATLLKLITALYLDDLTNLQYKLTHSASGLSNSYHSLTPAAHIQLWKQVLGRLKDQIESESTAIELRTRYSGQPERSEESLRLAISQLLFSAGQSKPLVAWLFPDGQPNSEKPVTELLAELPVK